MSNSTQPYKGSRDFYPEDKAFQKWMFGKWRRVVERYGYVEYGAPILEPTDIYLMKGSDEIVTEQTFTFNDRGDRSITIRTEMTPSVARMVAGKRQELSYPARWYSIPNLWRYERMQRGRLREFWQLNVDVFGITSIEAEFEMIQITDDLMQAFRAKRTSYEIKLNSRKLVNTYLTSLELSADQIAAIIRHIDKLHKLPTETFAIQLDNITQNKAKSQAVVQFLTAKKISELPESLRTHESAQELSQLINNLKAHGITNCVFDSSLMRGFDYYTDIVFEVFDTNPENNRSMFGGGRYDGLVAQFGAEPIPTVGFGMGDVTFQNFLETHKLIPQMRSSVHVRILPANEDCFSHARQAAHELREIGANTEVDYSQRKLEKQLKMAYKNKNRFVIIMSEDDIEEELYTLKDLKSGNESRHSLARISSIVLDARTK